MARLMARECIAHIAHPCIVLIYRALYCGTRCMRYSRAMATAGDGTNQPRHDEFKNVKPYCGDPLLETGPDRVPSLYVLSARMVLRGKIPFERCVVPTVLRKRLETYRSYEQWQGPKIMKCSTCWKFYTTQQKFDKHKCDRRRRH